MSKTMNTPLDPNALFNQLVKESQDLQATDAGNAGASGDQNKDGKKTASANGLVFDKSFFQKVAADDKEALEALTKFSSEALAAGSTAEEISAQIAAMETEAMAEPAGDADDAGKDGKPAADAEAKPAGGEDDGAGDVDDQFEAAAQEAEAEAVNKAIDDELANNDLAKAAGIDRDAVETWMIGERAGAAYFNGRENVRNLVDEIAESAIPTDTMIEGAIEVAKTAGLDVSKLEAEIADFKKQASTEPAPEGAAAKKAREAAETEQLLIDSLTALKVAGFDVEELAKVAEEKGKMSKGRAAAIGAAGGVGAGVAGTMLAKKYGPAVKGMASKAYDMAKTRMGKK